MAPLQTRSATSARSVRERCNTGYWPDNTYCRGIGLTTPIVAIVHLDSTMRNEGGEAASLESDGRLFSLCPHRGLKVFIESCRMMELSLSLGKRHVNGIYAIPEDIWLEDEPLGRGGNCNGRLGQCNGRLGKALARLRLARDQHAITS